VVATFEGRYWLIDPADMRWPVEPGSREEELLASARGWTG